MSKNSISIAYYLSIIIDYNYYVSMRRRGFMIVKKIMTMLFFCVFSNLLIAMEPKNYPSTPRIISNPSLGQRLTTTIQLNGPGLLSKEEFWMRNGTLINMYVKRDFPNFKSGIEFYGVGRNCDTRDERIAEAKRATDYIYADGILSMQDKAQYLELLYESIKRLSDSSMPLVVAKQYDMPGRQMTPLATANFAPLQLRDPHARSLEPESTQSFPFSVDYERNKARFWTDNGSLIYMYREGNFPYFRLAVELYGVCRNCNTQDERIAEVRRAADYIHSDTQFSEEDKRKYLELLYTFIGLSSAIILH